MMEYSPKGNQSSKLRNGNEPIDRILPNLKNLYEIYQKDNIMQKHTPDEGGGVQR